MNDTPTGAAPKTRAKRQRTWRPNFEDGPKTWDPAKIGVVRAYPKTQEAWEARKERQAAHARKLNAEGKMGRQGVPDGWAGRKDELAAVQREAQQEAAVMVAEICRLEPGEEDPMAREALEITMSIARDRSATATNRATAARLLLTFTRAPLTVQHVLAADPVDFLRGLAEAGDQQDSAADV